MSRQTGATLVLVGAILCVIGSIFIIALSFFFRSFLISIYSAQDAFFGVDAALTFYSILGIAELVAAGVLFAAYSNIKKGTDIHRWSIVAIVAGILSPVFLGTIGGIIALNSDDTAGVSRRVSGAAARTSRASHAVSYQSGSNNSMATASMVLGIIGLVFSIFWIFGFIGIILDILAIIFGIVGLNKTKEDPAAGGRGKAIAGLVMGAIGLVILILISIWLFAFVGSISSSISELQGAVSALQ